MIIKNIGFIAEKKQCVQLEVAKDLLQASNLAGKSINISKTTAAHAMAYKITSLYGYAHGHAVAICLVGIWEYMLDNMDQCMDNRGKGYVQETMSELAELLGSHLGFDALTEILKSFGIRAEAQPTEDEYKKLVASVNVERLSNHPIELSTEAIGDIYCNIFEKK